MFVRISTAYTIRSADMSTSLSLDDGVFEFLFLDVEFADKVEIETRRLGSVPSVVVRTVASLFFSERFKFVVGE